MKKILGISAFYHDAAATLTIGGRLVAAAQEERFTREKHCKEFPVNAVKFCLERAGLSLDELDAIVFYDKPLLKFERLLESYYAFAPKGLVSFLKAIPVWLDEKLFFRKLVLSKLNEAGPFDKKRLKLLFSEHHLSHAASAFYASRFKKAAILTVDGVGEWSTASIAVGEGNDITILREMNFPHSVGLLYSAFTYFLGFTVNSGEYKVMGLAPYGNPYAREVKHFIEVIRSQLVDIKEDGSIWLDQRYFNYATGLKMVRERKWQHLFGFGVRAPESALEQHHCNLALAIQVVVEDIIVKMARETLRVTNCRQLCMAGGVALNCVCNGKLLREGLFEDIFIQPAAGDAGGALGAALAISHMYFREDRQFDDHHMDQMEGAYLGPDFSDKEIELVSRKVKAVYKRFENFQALADLVAGKIASGNIVGWFQGRMEFGPRALGNRSILGDPRNPDLQKKLNLKIKYREGFRPFAPSVLLEDCQEYFALAVPSPYMLLVAQVRPERQVSLQPHFHEQPLMEKLYTARSDIQAVTHLDFSARVQTVSKETNQRYWELIDAFKKQTGYGLLVNTSFNVRGEPIVCTPYDAYSCFMRTEMDCLVIGDYLYIKEDQPDWANRGKWEIKFKPD